MDKTKNFVFIHGHTMYVVSAWFHCTCAPDCEHWNTFLILIKVAYFNAVRLFLHWRYNSLTEGFYNWLDNRTFNYLIVLRTKLESFLFLVQVFIFALKYGLAAFFYGLLRTEI